MKSFPSQLRKIREKNGWRQSDVADRTGLQPSAIGHFEAGRRSPSLKNLILLADAFKISIDELIGRKSK